MSGLVDRLRSAAVDYTGAEPSVSRLERELDAVKRAIDILTAAEATFRSNATSPNQWPVYRDIKAFLVGAKS